VRAEPVGDRERSQRDARSSTTTWVAIVDDGRVLRSWSSVVVGRAALIGIMLSGALRVRRRGARR
jgi:hypothetical protein